jgi:bifunctional DNA-binding transcriptional regulator/antitoxin component of YhaV-PrlF toxin-antitoxin module
MVGHSGEIALPNAVRERYGLTPETPLRLIETRSGILLVPLTDEPMNPELELELAEWQALSVQTWDSFPYEETDL